MCLESGENAEGTRPLLETTPLLVPRVDIPNGSANESEMMKIEPVTDITEFLANEKGRLPFDWPTNPKAAHSAGALDMIFLLPPLTSFLVPFLHNVVSFLQPVLWGMPVCWFALRFRAWRLFENDDQATFVEFQSDEYERDHLKHPARPHFLPYKWPMKIYNSYIAGFLDVLLAVVWAKVWSYPCPEDDGVGRLFLIWYVHMLISGWVCFHWLLFRWVRSCTFARTTRLTGVRIVRFSKGRGH